MKFTTLVFSVLVSANVFAANTVKDTGMPVAAAQPSLKTDMSFEGLTVMGKYQYADEAIAVVEDDKTLDDLLQLRGDFKDRLRKETKRK